MSALLSKMDTPETLAGIAAAGGGADMNAMI